MLDLNAKILVVDDMSITRRLVKNAVKALGYTNLTEAVDGQDGWEKVQAASAEGKPFQLVVSDWNMPRLEGIGLLKNIRKTPNLANTLFILVTAESEKSQIVEATQNKVNGYLLKPFTEEQLKAVFAKIAGKQAA